MPYTNLTLSNNTMKNNSWKTNSKVLSKPQYVTASSACRNRLVSAQADPERHLQSKELSERQNKFEVDHLQRQHQHEQKISVFAESENETRDNNRSTH